MNANLKTKLDGLYFQMDKFVKDLSIEPGIHEQDAKRMVSQLMGMLNMQVNSQWGIRLTAKEPEVEAIPEPVAKTKSGSKAVSKVVKSKG